MLGGSGELRHPGRHLGEQGQVPWTNDGPSLVPCKDHKATEKAEGTVTSVKERMLKALQAASQHPAHYPRGTRGTAPSGKNGSWVKAKDQ